MNTNLSSMALELIDEINITNLKFDITLNKEELNCLEKVEKEAKNNLSNILGSLCLTLENKLYIEGDKVKTIETFCNLTKTVLSNIMTIHSAKLENDTYVLFNNIWRRKVEYIVERIYSTLLY